MDEHGFYTRPLTTMVVFGYDLRRYGAVIVTLFLYPTQGLLLYVYSGVPVITLVLQRSYLFDHVFDMDIWVLWRTQNDKEIAVAISFVILFLFISNVVNKMVLIHLRAHK